MAVAWSASLRSVAEGAQQAHHVVVVRRRRRGAAGDPVEQVDVGAAEQGLESVELGAVKRRERGLGERAEDEVDLLRAAVPGAEQELPAANVRSVHLRFLTASGVET